MNKNFLISKLKLSKHLLRNEKEDAIKLAGEISELSLDDNEKEQINDVIKQYLNEDGREELLKEVINALKFDNTEFMLAILELKLIKDPRTEENKKLLEEKIMDENKINFVNEFDEYFYYSLIVNLTINSMDSTLIELAIEKIQNL